MIDLIRGRLNLTVSQTSPYSVLPEDAFWRNAVGSKKNPLEITGLWKPKFKILPADKVSTYGSCFAQHFGRNLRERGYTWFTPEKPPIQVSAKLAQKYNYDIFSSRTANIYTASLLLQWTRWAFGLENPPHEIWKNGDYFIDPFRPRIEPEGFVKPSEMFRLRDITLEYFRQSIVSADVFVFTLGLTERWYNRQGSYEYPMCPGTAGGDFDADQHVFENLSYEKILQALNATFAILREHNPTLRILLTVSPVPLTATASGQHVLTATMRSKALLRTVADSFAANMDYVDYFPSYEIISSPVFRGKFFEDNLRGVRPDGVKFVMDNFFRDMTGAFGIPKNVTSKTKPKNAIEEGSGKVNDLVCEEELLAAFGVRE